MNSGSCHEMMTSYNNYALDPFSLVTYEELVYYIWHDLHYIFTSFLVLGQKQT